MLSLPPSVRIFVAVDATDMRKSFDGLASEAQRVIAQDPLSGHLFVFFNRRRTMVKVLYWDRNGFCLVAKRLERGNVLAARGAAEWRPGDGSRGAGADPGRDRAGWRASSAAMDAFWHPVPGDRLVRVAMRAIS